MKKIIANIFTVAASVLVVASCDLNLSPDSAIAYVEGTPLIQTESNLNAMRNGLLSAYRSVQNGDYVIPQELMFDGFNATIDFGNNYGPLHKTDVNFTSADYDIEDYWAGNYYAIKNYNVYISAADDVKDELKEGARIAKGYAFFFRASSYLNLARHFGKAYSSSASTDLCVPLVLKYDPTDRPARATVAEVYDSIKKDLDSAAVILAGVKGAPRSKTPTIDAVNALYARYYIDIKDNAKAAEYAHKVIDGGLYPLENTYDAINADFINDEGTEPILQLAISMTEFTGNDFSPWLLPQSDKNVDEGECFRPYYLPSRKLVESYDASDIRLSWFDNQIPVLFSGRYYKGDFYTFVKFRGNPSLTSTPIRNCRQAPKPLRISEMYLIAAEAELAAGNAGAAKTDLNALQAARGASLSAATAATIQNEWFKETVGEGLRMSCLKRWGVGFSGRAAQAKATNVVQQGEFFTDKKFDANSTFFQWPIPSHELKVNSNLVQNPGYDSI